MNTFKKTFALVAAAATLGIVASSQAFAWDNCEHGYQNSSDYSYNYTPPSYSYTPPSYSYQPYHYGYGYGYGHHYGW